MELIQNKLCEEKKKKLANHLPKEEDEQRPARQTSADHAI